MHETDSAARTERIEYRVARDLPRDGVLVLYGACRWSSADKPDQLMAALAGSHTVITAWDGDRLIGLGNAITDGALVVYYPHLLVHPDYQRRGVGREILRRLMERYEGYHQQAVLADDAAISFYRDCGFTQPANVRAMWVYSATDHGPPDSFSLLRDVFFWEGHTGRQKLAIVLAIAQIVASVVAWLSLGWGDKVLITWPALALIGFAFALMTWPCRSWPAFAFGISAPVVTAIAALLIVWVEWLGSPYRPSNLWGLLHVLIFVYTIVLVPLGVIVVRQMLAWRAPPRSAVHERWQFSVKSLLIVMTAVALGAGLLGAVLREVGSNTMVALVTGYGLGWLAVSGVAIYYFVAGLNSGSKASG